MRWDAWIAAARIPSMLRHRRLCRIALRRITAEIGERYQREQLAEHQ